MPDTPAPALVILDANTWVATSLLQGPLGSALLYTLHSTGYQIGLPAIVEREVESAIARRVADAVAKIIAGYKTVLGIMGRRDAFRVPTVADAREQVRKRFSDLNQLIVRLPFTFSHATGALSRIIEKAPPNAKTEQFRDSAIWEAALEASNARDVHFVTEDNAFFESASTTDLAESLRSEAAQSANKLQVYRGLRPLLQYLRNVTPPLEHDLIASALFAAVRDEVAPHAAKYDFELVDLTNHEIATFLTEQPLVLAISYTLRLSAIDTQSEPGERAGDYVIIRGSAFYDPSAQDVSDVRSTTLKYFTAAGDHLAGKGFNIIYVPPIVIGRGTVTHSFREPLDIMS